MVRVKIEIEEEGKTSIQTEIKAASVQDAFDTLEEMYKGAIVRWYAWKKIKDTLCFWKK